MMNEEEPTVMMYPDEDYAEEMAEKILDDFSASNRGSFQTNPDPVYTVTVRGVEFSAAHRLAWHPKCRRWHGHNYKVRVDVTGELDGSRRIVMEMGRLKKMIEELADKLDHRVIIGATEHADEFAGERSEDVVRCPLSSVTAEDLATWFVRWIRDHLSEDERRRIRRIRASVAETDGFSAAVSVTA